MEGRYQRYLEYKDSGVEWLGVIPNHWSRLKFSLLADQGKVFASGPFGSSIGSQFYQDSGVPVIRGNNLSIDGNKPLFHDNGYVFLTEEKANELSNAEVRPGDLVFTARGTVGQVGLVPDDGSIEWPRAILSANQLRFRNKKNGINTKYFWYLFSSWLVRTQILLSSDSVAQPNLNLGSLKALYILLPSSTEQQQIANFLDHETAKIDTLIAKQKQLISLLKEKRQAVISHAVTKGLNPDAPMKDSGVEWLGEVPEHWTISRVKFHSSVKGRIGFRGYTVDDLVDESEGALVLGASEMNMSGQIEVKNPQYISWDKYYESPEIMLEEGMILFVQRGSTVGKVAYVEGGLGKATINPSLIVIRDMEVEPQFLTFSLMGTRIQNVVKMHTASTAIPMISQEQVGNYYILIPPKQEQKEVSSYIAIKTNKIAIAMDAALRSLELLQERRIALISAAVTGKIDVRNWRPPTDSKTERDIQ